MTYLASNPSELSSLPWIAFDTLRCPPVCVSWVFVTPLGVRHSCWRPNDEKPAYYHQAGLSKGLSSEVVDKGDASDSCADVQRECSDDDEQRGLQLEQMNGEDNSVLEVWHG